MPDTSLDRYLFAADIKKPGPITASIRLDGQRGRPARRSARTARRQRATETRAARTITAAGPCPAGRRQALNGIHAT